MGLASGVLVGSLALAGLTFAQSGAPQAQATASASSAAQATAGATTPTQSTPSATSQAETAKPNGPGRGQDSALDDAVQPAIAQALGMTRADYDAQLAKGQTPLQIAQAKGQTQGQFTQLVKDAATKVLRQAVTAGTLTKAQADQMLPDLTGDALKGSGPGHSGVAEVGQDSALHDPLQTAIAQALGLTRAVYDAQLAKGQTPLQIAQTKGLTQDQFNQLLKDAASQVIQQAVTDGTITQRQADQLMPDLTDDAIVGPGPGGPVNHRGGPQSPIIDALQTAIAQALGLTRADYDAQLAKGQTPLQIAQARGQTRDPFTQLVKATAAKVLQQAVAAGTLTQAQADQITQRLATDPLEFIAPRHGHGRGFGPRRDPDNDQPGPATTPTTPTTQS
jgi:polyhydroxyalkanoate synthesis regulator phasin